MLSRLESAPARNGNGASSAAALPAHPLEGITLLDLSTVIAGPLACSLTYELGVRVIHVETLEGDTMRRNFDGLGGNRTQAGAENLSINLQTPEGKEVFQRLAAKADVIVHNMRPGAPERLGAGYEQVRQINPNIVYIYAGGYGDSGPHSHRPAMHPIGGAVIGGAMNQLGRGVLPPADQPMSVEEIQEVARRLGRANETNPDPNSSMVISTGVLLGLYARERFGGSHYILSTMIGANAYANADDFFSYEGKPDRLSLRTPTGTGCTPCIACTRPSAAMSSSPVPLRRSGNPCATPWTAATCWRTPGSRPAPTAWRTTTPWWKSCRKPS